MSLKIVTHAICLSILWWQYTLCQLHSLYWFELIPEQNGHTFFYTNIQINSVFTPNNDKLCNLYSTMGRSCERDKLAKDPNVHITILLRSWSIILMVVLACPGVFRLVSLDPYPHKCFTASTQSIIVYNEFENRTQISQGPMSLMTLYGCVWKEDQVTQFHLGTLKLPTRWHMYPVNL